MALTFSLVEATPHRLRYLARKTGGGIETANILNDGGASPDLRTDILAVGAQTGTSGLPLQDLIRARQEGYSTHLPGALNQAQARALFMSDASTPAGAAILTHPGIQSGVVEVWCRGTYANWAVDVNVDGQGDPVIVVVAGPGPANADTYAYVDLHSAHTEDT